MCDTLRFRARVSGTGTATLSGKVRKVGTTEPANRQTTKTDTEPTLQTAGAFGLQAYASKFRHQRPDRRILRQPERGPSCLAS